MAKLITQVAQESVEETKMVKIKNTRTMQDSSGKDVEVIDFVESKPLDAAIADAEANKARLEARLAEVDAELVDLNAIKDA
jgi:hypothetical protein|tara:strand:+ start:195 stop:437 length:243 start_codon:yes stop_codon:yes gene_type:complete